MANGAFAALFDYRSAEDCESTLLMDLLADFSKSEFRDFLADAHNSTAKKPTTSRPLNIITDSGATKPARLRAHHLELDGEKLIQVELVTDVDSSIKGRWKRWPWKLYSSIFCLMLAAILPNLLLPNLNINNSPSTYLPPSAPSVVMQQKVRSMFPNDQVVILLFEGVALFSDGFLTSYNQLVESLESKELIKDVISVTNQDHISGSADGFVVEPLININDLTNSRPQERKAKAASDRFAQKTLVAEDGSAIAMIIIPDTLNDSIRYLRLEQDILDTVEKHQLTGYISAKAGNIINDVEQMRTILRDNMIFIPATVIIGLLLVWWLFHRWIAVIVTGITTGAVVACTIVFYVIFDQPFNSISGIIPPLLSALTIAALVHFFNALHYASKRGLISGFRVQAALDEIRNPALFSALTTAAGLASLALSPIPPIRTFGLASAVGVLIIYGIVIHILPPIFTRFDSQPWPSRKSGMALMGTLVQKMVGVGIRYPLWVMAGFTLFLLVATPQVTNVKVETNILEFFSTQHPLRQSTDHINAKLVGTTPLEVLLTAKPGYIIKPSKLEAIKDFQAWLNKQPEVDKTLSVIDFVEEMHWGFNNEDNSFRRIPEKADLISQYLFIYDGDDLFDFVDNSYSNTRVSMNLNVHGANEISDLMQRIRKYFSVKPIPDVTIDISGESRLFADQEDLLIEGQLYSLAGALALILTLMLVLWRSIKDALICMVPNMSPIILIFIMMGFFSIWLDMATAMIASVAVGIAIDDTIHIFHGFIKRVRAGVSPTVALARTYSQAGRAVMTTTIILCSQFLLLLASDFRPMNHFGLLTSVGLLAALVFDLLLLPALLVAVYKKREPL